MGDGRDVRRARLFKNAGNLAVRLPVDWNVEADEADLTYDGTTITVTPIPRRESLTDLLAEFARDPIEDDWGDDPVGLGSPKDVSI